LINSETIIILLTEVIEAKRNVDETSIHITPTSLGVNQIRKQYKT